MSDNLPLVSICIPTYNRADMVGKAIESALAQTYPHIEVLVVDNASTDNTADVVTRYRDPRLKFFKNPANLGLFGNFNRCIELARGEFIHILHSDDYIDPKFTETCIRFFKEHPSVGLTFTQARYISGTTQATIAYSDKDEMIAAPEGFKRILTGRQFIVCPSVMVRRGVYDDVGSYAPDYPYSSDYYQWLTITRRYDIGYVHSATLFYVQGEHSETYRLLFNNPDGYIDTLRIYIRVLEDLGPERGRFTAAMNTALRRYILDCLFAGATRTDLMKDVKSSFFTNISLDAWREYVPVSTLDRIRKTLYRIAISLTGAVISVSLFRRIIRRCFAGSKNMY
jgi:glycosyltransferase involved in cell wall biosynthesis